MTPKTSVSTKNTSTRKSLSWFTETLYVKHKTAVWRFCKVNEKHKAIKKSNVLWSKIANRCGHAKINQKARDTL